MAKTKVVRTAPVDPVSDVTVTNVQFAFGGPAGPEPHCFVTLVYMKASGATDSVAPQIVATGEAFNDIVKAFKKMPALGQDEVEADRFKSAILEALNDHKLLPKDVVLS